MLRDRGVLFALPKRIQLIECHQVNLLAEPIAVERHQRVVAHIERTA